MVMVIEAVMAGACLVVMMGMKCNGNGSDNGGNIVGGSKSVMVMVMVMAMVMAMAMAEVIAPMMEEVG